MLETLNYTALSPIKHTARLPLIYGKMTVPFLYRLPKLLVNTVLSIRSVTQSSHIATCLVHTNRLEKYVMLYTRCGNKETGLLLLLISGHVDD